MPIVIKREQRGLAWPLLKGFRPIAVPHFRKGEKVRIVAAGWAFHKTWKCGDEATVENYMPAGGLRDRSPEDDVYQLRLVAPRTECAVIYLRFGDCVRSIN